MTNLPIPDMSAWSVLDFELAFDGVNHLNDASLWLQNQPRASTGGGEYHPGADFIVAVGEQWCNHLIDEMIDTLKSRRFPDPGDDDRRVLLLIQHAAVGGPSGDSLAEVMQMALQQSVRPAAA